MSSDSSFGTEPTRTREEMFGLDQAAVAAAGLTTGVADAVAECALRYEEAIRELAAYR